MAKGKGKSSVSLAEIDEMMRKAYDEVKAELNRVEAELADMKKTRDGLAARVRQLELGLGLSAGEPSEAASIPASEPTTSSASATRSSSSGSSSKRGASKSKSKAKSSRKGRGKGKSGGRKRRRRGALWHDVQAVMTGSGNMQASKVIQALIESHGYDDSESVRTRVYNSLGRWAREGKLRKSGRGVYSL